MVKSYQERSVTAFGGAVLRFTEAAACGRYDGKGFSRLQHGLVAVAKYLDRAILAADFIAAGLARFSTFQTERRYASVTGEDREIERLQCADGAFGAVTRVPFALPPEPSRI